ncbi:unnamed protein product [Urochloa decumbens]|uniref:Uncharacterized protein n=1 Tax=Urochloa decumbens TaxID=240449 RepID=A0ABC9FCB5_9POAL
MASGSRGRGRGRGSRAARGGAPPPAVAAAAAPALPPALAALSDPHLATLPAVDLVSRLIGCNRRASDFVDVALVLAARERRLADAEARARAAEEDAARLRRQIAAEAQVRRLVAEMELGLRAEIRAWQRRAAQAEARLIRFQAHAQADLTGGGEAGKAQAEEEEAPLQAAVSGKRKEAAAASSPDKRLKKLIKLPAGGGCCSSNAAVLPESEADTTIDEAEDEDAREDQDALEIAPLGRDVHGGLEMGTDDDDMQGIGEDDQPEDKTRGEPEEFEPEINPVALVVVAPGNDLLPLNDGGIGIEAATDLKAAGGHEKEPDELARTAAASAQGSGDNYDSANNDVLPENGAVMDMEVSHAAATRSGERGAGDSCQCLAAEPQVMPVLYAPLPKESVDDVEERPRHDDDKDAPQQ